MLKAAPGRSIASGPSLRASLPGVLVVLSGMSSEEQLADNLAAMSPFQPLTKSEQNALTRAVLHRQAGPAHPPARAAGTACPVRSGWISPACSSVQPLRRGEKHRPLF